jgi:hypothetical protein
MSPRVIQLPLSGGDRKHYVRELREAELAHAAICERVKVGYWPLSPAYAK